jgi:5'(3')-deoxyribonucleotidase
MRVAIDLDGVCYEFQRTYRYMANLYLHSNMPPVDDFWFEWDACDEYTGKDGKKWMWTEGVKKGLFRYGHMTTGARHGLEVLAHEGHELVIVTHRPAIATPDTVDWLSLYFQDLQYNLHILSNGEPKTSVKWDVLVDDKYSNVEDVGFGRTGILFGRTWSECAHDPDVIVADGWKEVVDAVRNEGQRKAPLIRQRHGA